MKSFYLLAFLAIFLSCSKSEKSPVVEYISPDNPEWLQTKIKEYSSCRCLIEMRTSTYNSKPVVEFRLIDPLCDGINVIYDENGNQLFHSGDKDRYDAYLRDTKNLKTVWNCRDGAKS